MVSAVLFITFFVLLVLNVPISVCLGLSSAAAILYSGTSLTIVATNIYSGISNSCCWRFRFSYYPEISWRRRGFPRA